MTKKALCVGINDYPYDGSDLNGCINDARAWADLLVNHFGFSTSDIRLLLDSNATRKNILTALKDLLTDVIKGDTVVFTNSSHGTYVADVDGDEEKYDEAICPYDCNDNLIVDDELRALISNVTQGVHLTIISDSCFSGTVTRAPINEIIPGLRTPDDRRVRFLSPALRGDKVLQNPWKARANSNIRYPESSMKEILLSGCSDKEYSYDAFIDGKYHGAMSYFAQQIIKTANYQITYQQLHDQLLAQIDQAGYPQHPQLEGKRTNKKEQIFS